MGNLIVLYGPSAAGKTTISELLGLEKTITATTRKKRVGEKDGIDYHFKTKKKFEEMIVNGDLIEHTEYLGDLYGCPKDSLVEVLNGEGTKVIVLDLEGVLSLKENYPNESIKYLYIGAYIDVIKRRLQERNISDKEFDERISKAETKELSHKYIQHADEIIWNNDGMDVNGVIEHIKKLIKIWNY